MPVPRRGIDRGGHQHALILGNRDDAHVETVRLVLDAGARPGLADRDGVTARQHAVNRGQTAVVAEIDRRR